MNGREFIKKLKESLRLLKTAGVRGSVPPQGEGVYEWLCDNRYLLLSTGDRLIKPARGLNKLPKRGERVLTVADGYVKAANGRLTFEELDGFLLKNELTDKLTTAEFDLLPLCITGFLLIFASDAIALLPPDGESRIAAAVTSLRELDAVGFDKLTERHSSLSKLLKDNVCYAVSDSESKAQIRKRVEYQAKRRRIPQNEYAKTIKNNACPPAREHTAAKTLRVLALAILSALASALTGIALQNVLLPLLLYPAYFAIILPICDFFTLRLLPPKRLLRVDVKRGIPEGGETAVAVSCLLSDAKSAKEAFSRIESFMYANRDERLIFGVLGDLPDAINASMPADKAALRAAKDEFERLNDLFPEKFFLFLRRREFSKTQREYSGRERKRGAINDFLLFCRGGRVDGATFLGSRDKAEKCKFLLALDGDTDLPIGSAKALVSIAMHPENAPVIDRGRVVAGHGVFAPRASTSLSAWLKTPFSRAMAMTGGASAYTGAVGDVYQDLYGRGLFCGKGLFDIDAALAVADALPKQCILSHDTPESCLLRAAFVSDVELTDGCPSTAGGWFRRLHRWTRGDVQNLIFLFDPRFDALSKWKIYNNVRRSLTAQISFLTLLISPFLPSKTAAVAVAVSLLSLDFGAYMSVALSAVGALFRRCERTGISVALTNLRKIFAGIVTAAENFFVLLDATARAIFRMTVSKRNLLSWTTAAQGDKSGFSCVKGAAVGAAAAAATLSLGENLYILPLCMLWIAAPFITSVWDRPLKSRAPHIGETDRGELINYAAAAWGYFESTLTEKRGFLPPDNIQCDPVGDTAERTSPTNIGLALLSVLAARDMELISTKKAADIIAGATDTCTGLKKYRGNLYNWYSLIDFEPLDSFVSSVDSGNFLCCLIALRQGLTEYLREDRRLFKIINDIDGLIKNTDLSAFCDPDRNRFVTGLEVTKNGVKMSGSCYDLLMSEALLSIYCGTAAGMIDKKIFDSLGRLCGRKKNVTGALSWTGTMFEYFMPPLLLPVFSGSLIASSLKYAYICQRERSSPWGVSESGLYGFDDTLHYRYRAHGVQNAALCRNQNRDLVISPYSSFLTLSIAPASAIENLRRLKDRGMFGEYGFFEALDLTASHTGGADGIVKSYMAHHVGMSMVAAANCLYQNVFVRRFLRDPAMAAAQDLLRERVPSGEPVYRGYLETKTARPPRVNIAPAEYGDISPASPRAAVLTGGSGLTLSLSDCGTASLTMGDIDVTANSRDLVSNPQGVFFVLGDGKRTAFLTNAPDYSNGDGLYRQARFSQYDAAYRVHLSGLDAELSFVLSPNKPHGAVCLTVKNLTGKRKTASALGYFEPMLCRHGDAAAHRAFQKLFLSVKKADGVTLFSRREGRGQRPLTLAVTQTKDADCRRCFDREKLLIRPLGVQSLINAPTDAFCGFDRDGFYPELCGAAAFEVSLPPYSVKSVKWYFAVDEDEKKAALSAKEAQSTGVKAMQTAAAKAAQARAAAAGMSGMDAALERLILPSLLYQSEPDALKASAIKKLGTKGRGELWSVGISGDLPILLCEQDGFDENRVRTCLRIYKHLTLCGLKLDLVFLCRDGHEYLRKNAFMIKNAISAEGLMHVTNKSGGVFAVDVSDRENLCLTLRAFAAFIAQGSVSRLIKRQKRFSAVPVYPASPSPAKADGDGWLIDPSAAPHRPWCHVLCNDVFGTLVSDKRIGFTYARQSTQNRLTPWTNDPCADLHGERVFLDIFGRRYDLIASAAVTFTKQSAVYESVCENIKATVTVSLCGRLPIKRVNVKLDKAHKDARVTYYTEPPAERAQPIMRFDESGNALFFENMSNAHAQGVGFLTADAKAEFMTDRLAFLSNEKPSRACAYLCAAASVRGKTDVTFKFGFVQKKEALFKLINSPDAPPKKRDAIDIQSGDSDFDKLVNVFLPHQITAVRMRARAAFYQCSGATGFRDQLQDACAAVVFDPDIARKQIIRSSSRQFTEGDVLHWWEDAPGCAPRGTRTKCSDDLLWLPYAVHRFIEVTNDVSVLSVRTPYLSAPSLSDESERLVECEITREYASVYAHCLSAIRRADRRGEHGLLLIGSCDWNDGLSNVGVKGRGETVWGTQFYSLVCRRFAKICRLTGDEQSEKELLSRADSLDKAWKAQFDFDRYIRAYTDGGEPLGKKGNAEMEIDILPQAFAAILDPDGVNGKTALVTAEKLLVDRENGLIRLFTPPFDEQKSVGYIAAYPAGVRENGGQYTHGAVWYLFALCRAGEYEKAWEYAKMLSPTDKEISVYGGEPYYLAGDVCTNANALGRAGWTLYTGAAGWYYRLLIEELYGIRRRGDRVYISPHLQKNCDGFFANISLKRENKTTHIALTVRRTGRSALTVNGDPAEYIAVDGGKKEVFCEII